MDDVVALLESLKDSDFGSAWASVNREAAAAEYRMRRGKRSEPKRQSAQAYRGELGRVLFWFHHGGRATGMPDHHWRALLALAETLKNEPERETQ